MQTIKSETTRNKYSQKEVQKLAALSSSLKCTLENSFDLWISKDTASIEHENMLELGFNHLNAIFQEIAKIFQKGDSETNKQQASTTVKPNASADGPGEASMDPGSTEALARESISKICNYHSMITEEYIRHLDSILYKQEPSFNSSRGGRAESRPNSSFSLESTETDADNLDELYAGSGGKVGVLGFEEFCSGSIQRFKEVSKALESKLVNFERLLISERFLQSQKLSYCSCKSTQTPPTHPVEEKSQSLAKTKKKKKPVRIKDCGVSYGTQISSTMSPEPHYTIVSFKNKNSFLAVQNKVGFCMFEDGRMINFDNPINNNYRDVIFNKDYYFIYEENTGIWKMSIKNRTREIWLEIKSEAWEGRSLRIGLNGKALVFYKDCTSIMVIEIESETQRRGKRILTVQKDFGGAFFGVEVFGKDQDMLACLTRDGWLQIYQFDLMSLTSKVVGSLSMKMIAERNEIAVTLGVCPKSRYILIHTRNNNKSSFKASRVFFVEFRDGFLIRRNCLDLYDSGQTYFLTTGMFYLDWRTIVISAITHSSSSSHILTFEYDVGEDRLVEREDLRNNIGAVYPKKISLFDKLILCTDKNARFIKVQYYLDEGIEEDDGEGESIEGSSEDGRGYSTRASEAGESDLLA